MTQRALIARISATVVAVAATVVTFGLTSDFGQAQIHLPHFCGCGPALDPALDPGQITYRPFRYLTLPPQVSAPIPIYPPPS
jgi:hypothetical protein